jgi:2-oxoglutarate ferredoxin oxidoreductase subunit beta
MTYLAKPKLHHPSIADQRSSASRGATTRARSRRCAPAAATTRSARRSCRPASSSTSAAPGRQAVGHRLLVEDADYFLGAAHGFNSVHGRMPSVLTGANLANRDLIYLGVSGDGDSASIGFGQFAHSIRRGVNMVYIVENNGVYGLTKGQFSATADKGSKSKKGVGQFDSAHRPRRTMALQLGATFVAALLGRQGAAGAADQGGDANIAARPSSMCISPCVAFNNHAGSTKSFDYVREHNEAVNRLDVISDLCRQQRRRHASPPEYGGEAAQPAWRRLSLPRRQGARCAQRLPALASGTSFTPSAVAGASRSLHRQRRHGPRASGRSAPYSRVATRQSVPAPPGSPLPACR